MRSSSHRPARIAPLRLLLTLGAVAALAGAAATVAGNPLRPRQAQGQAPQVPPGSAPVLDLDQLFVSSAWNADSLGPFRWLDARHYARLEPSASTRGAKDIVRYDADTGERRVLVDAARLVPDVGRHDPLPIEQYSLSNDGRWLLVFTNSRRVWRRNTRGDYWLLDLHSGQLHQIGGTGREAVLQFAKFSPDSTRVAFVRDHDLFVEDLRTGTITRLTRDGSDTVTNGTSDWVYEEELSIRDGYRWSPDGRAIAFWQIDDSLVREFVLVDYTSQLYPLLKRFPYPKVGQVNPAARAGVVASGGGEVQWIDLPGSPRDNYIARLDWADNSRELAIQYLNRRQNVNRLFVADPRTGRVRLVLREADEAWVDIRDDMRWIDHGRAFLWSSERDGWRRLYRVRRDGSSLQPLTPEGMDVLGVEGVDEQDGWLYYAATTNPTRRALYRVPLQPEPAARTAAPQQAVTEGPHAQPAGGRGDRVDAELLSPDQGWHQYRIAPGARFALHTVSSFAQPPRVEIIRLPEHTAERTLVDNARLAERMQALDIRYEMFRVAVEPGVQLDAWAILPPGLDPARHYPVLVYVYGEPAGQTVLDRWGGKRTLWHAMLAQRGYVVLSFDNRGTPAPRGRAWRKAVYGQVGILASHDQAEALRTVLQQRPYLDADRVGIWGWSGGGSMTLNAMFRYPDLYRVGMSVAPVPDQHYYDTIYQERYMGLLEDNPDGYRRGSPITYASQLRGDLLLVHGTGDDNVHYQGTAALIDRLVAAGKQFSMMAYPNRTHAIREGQGTTRHLYGLLTRFLLEHLPPGPR